MKKVLLLLSLITISTLIYSQDRINKPKPVVSDKALGSISYALGCYYYESLGEWSESDNSISLIDSFIKFEFRGMVYKGLNYLVLIKYMKEGAYEYPYIQEGYYEYTKTSFYIISLEDYDNQLKNVGFNGGLIACDVVAMGSGTSGISGVDTLLTDIIYALNKDSNPDRKTKLYIQYKNDTSKDISRFLIFDETSSMLGGYTFFDYGGFKTSTLIHENKDWLKNLKEETIFNYLYYETDLGVFDKFIKSPIQEHL